jgi:hypothetical protein
MNPTSTAAAPVATANLDRGVFTIGNELVRLVITHQADGRLLTSSFQDLQSGTEWCDGSRPAAAFALNYGAPGQAERRDRTGTDRWELIDAQARNDGEESSLVLRLADSAGLAEVTLHFTAFGDAPIVRGWNVVKNAGTETLELSKQQFLHIAVNPFGTPLAARWVSPFNWDNDRNGFRTHDLELGDFPELHLVGGGYGGADCPALNRGEKLRAAPPQDERPRLLAYGLDPSLEDRLGPYRESCGWFVVDHSAAERGLFGGWEWSGAVDATIKSDPSGLTEISIGHLDELFTHMLEPGEEIESPVAFVGLFSGDLDDAGDITRRLAEAHYIPERPQLRFLREGAEFPYLMADTWGASSGWPTRREEYLDEPIVHKLIEQAAEYGVEVFSLDKAWERVVGDWHAADGFPNGIRGLSDHAHKHGMSFSLWCPWGSADPSSPVAKEHPDWLATWDGEPAGWSWGWHSLCLGHEPAREWVISELDRMIVDYDLDWILHDMEMIARCNSTEHTHQPGSANWSNTKALYETIDHIRAKYPHMIVENCWNGGRMIDFGMLKRHDTSIGDDWNLAISNRLASYGMTRFMPAYFSSKWMADEPTLPPRYAVRSCIFGGPWYLMGDWPSWSDEMKRETHAAIEIYKRTRAMIARSQVFHLGEPHTSSSGWDAIEAYDESTDAAIIFAYRGHDFPPGTSTVPQPLRAFPRGLEPERSYRVTYQDRDDSFVATGAEIATDGVPLDLWEHFTTDIAYIAGEGR